MRLLVSAGDVGVAGSVSRPRSRLSSCRRHEANRHLPEPPDLFRPRNHVPNGVLVHQLAGDGVVDAGQLLGVISLSDIAREATREIGAKKPEVTPAEIGETLAAIRQPRELPAVGTA